MKRRLDAAARQQRHNSLQHLTGLGLPATKLQKVLVRLREHQSLLDCPINLRNIRDAQEEIFRQVVERRDFVLDDGSTFHWDFCNVGKALDVMSHSCSEFGELLQELHAKQPSSMEHPWGLVVYFDETIPGDPLRLDQRKKFMSVYMAIKNLGPTYLKHERYWFPIAICRTNIIKHVPGKWSHMLKVLLRSMVLDAPSIRAGVPLRCLQHGLVFFKISNILGDEDALRQGWSHKGANAVFPCMSCHNVCNKGARSVVRDNDPFFVEIGATDVSKFRRCTDSELWHKVDVLAAAKGRLTRAEFDRKEMGFGLIHNDDGLLQDRELRPFIRPMELQTHDPTHVLFADGICNTELTLLLPVLEKCRPALTLEMLHTYFTAAWKLPRAWRNNVTMRDVFSPQRVKHFRRMGTIQAFASEMMSIVPPLAHYLASHPIRLQIPDHVKSFLALGVLVRMMAKAKIGMVGSDELAAAFMQHGELFKQAYRGEGIKAKFHYARELPYQLLRDGMLLDTFTCERKHSMMKLAAEPIDNTSTFERTCLARALTLHQASLRDGIRDGLVHGQADPGTAALLGVVACTIAKDIRVDGTLLGTGDIIYISATQPVEVRAPVELVFGADQSPCLGFLVDVLHFVQEAGLDS